MNCTKCGANVVNGDSFCRNCGASINTLNQIQNSNLNVQQNSSIPNQLNIGDNQLSNQVNNQNGQVVNQNIQVGNAGQNNNVQGVFYTQSGQQINNTSDPDEDLKRAFIGDKYEDFKYNKGASPVWILLFGALYTIYRKMYLLSILWIVGSVIISIFLSGFGTVISIIFKIYLMIKFNNLYLKHVDDEIEKIKYDNQGKSRNDIIKICAKKGGTSAGAVIGIIMVYFALIVLVAVPLVMKTIEEVKNGAMESQVYSYIEKVENEIAYNKATNDYYEIPSIITDNTFVDVYSNQPDSVYINVDSSGKVISATIKYGDKSFEYSNGEVKEI